jgi:oligoribonuclease NrnB/cAMP/cGMP phosphodiesterase (DHH superfamily)
MRLFIYFHKDFDGIVSAALLTAIFKKLGKYQEFVYKPVDLISKMIGSTCDWSSLQLF